MKNVVKFLTLVFAMLINSIINGFVFSKLWLWLIVPTFKMQPLRVVEAIGVLIIISFVFYRTNKEEENDAFWETLANSMIHIVLLAGFALLSGWVLSLFL